MKSGDELWRKEQVIRDFSKIFSDPSTNYEVGEKWFEISRAPMLYSGQKEKVGETPDKNVHNGEFWPLALEEIHICMEVAVDQTLMQ